MPQAIERLPIRARAVVRRGVYAHLFSEYAADENMVASYWNAQGCSIERLDTETKKNPDFLITFRNGMRAICEVKSFGGPETGASDYGLEYDPNQRLSNALYSGIAQLTNYEQAGHAFRVLFFVNHNENLTFHSLVRMLDGEWDPLALKFRDEPNAASIDARLQRRKVDLYLWIRDTANSSSESPSQHWGNLDRVGELYSSMQQNPSQIRVIQAA
jgi:hypothetical protein